MLFTIILTAFATLAACFRNGPRSTSSDNTGYSGQMVPSYNISIPVDHFNQSDARMYNNRHWVNDTFYKPGGPVFFLDYAMKGVSDEAAAIWLAEINGTTSVMALAAQYHGLAILWEHRYYGYSLPVSISPNETSTVVDPIDGPADWSYLTFEQALEDVVYFAKNLQSGGFKSNDSSALAPAHTPWVWLGDVYSGSRGAVLRICNPEIIYAVWASSASVESIYDGSTWYNAVESSMYSNCSTDVRAIVAHIDQVLSGNSSSQEYIDIQRCFYLAYDVVGTASATGNNLTTYNILAADTLSRSSIATIMSTAFYTYPAHYGPTLSTNLFCDYLESYNPSAPGLVTKDQYISVLTNPGNGTPSAEGFLASRGNNTTLGVQAYAFAAAKFQKDALTQLAPIDGAEIAPNSYDGGAAATYQALTELGWIVGSNPNNITIISKFANYTGIAEFARGFYFSQAAANAIPSQLNVSVVNKYGGWNMNSSNVMFTNGQFDPWQAAGVFATESGGPRNQVTTTVPSCGSAPKDGTRFGIVYPDAGSGWGLRATELLYGYSIDEGKGVSFLLAGSKLFTEALNVWLHCSNIPSQKSSSVRKEVIWMPIVVVVVVGVMLILAVFWYLQRRAIRKAAKPQDVRSDSYDFKAWTLSRHCRPQFLRNSHAVNFYCTASTTCESWRPDT